MWKPVLAVVIALPLVNCAWTQDKVSKVEGFGAKVEGAKVILHCQRNFEDRVAYEKSVNDYILENEPDGKTIYLRPICPGD
jgi:hypothetical protein